MKMGAVHEAPVLDVSTEEMVIYAVTRQAEVARGVFRGHQRRLKVWREVHKKGKDAGKRIFKPEPGERKDTLRLCRYWRREAKRWQEALNSLKAK